jgi:hypothetical protein
VQCVCVFISAGPNTKLFAWGGGDIGGHVLRETTNRGQCELDEPRTVWLVCPSRTSERGGEGDCVKEGGGGEGKCERERAILRLIRNADAFGVYLLLQDLLRVYYCSTYYKTVRKGCVCVFYYCRTYYKAVRGGGGGAWRTCAMRDDEPRTVWMSLLITH